MGRSKSSSHSTRANFNYVLKQLKKSNMFILSKTKNGILIKRKQGIIANNNNNNDNNNKKYIIHMDSNKLHEFRRWLKREFEFKLILKN